MEPSTLKSLLRPDPSHAWDLIKDKVISQLIGGVVIGVPHLTDVYNYDLLNVIIKYSCTTLEKFNGKVPSFRSIGHLAELIYPMSSRDLLNEGFPGTKSQEKFKQRYKYKEEEEIDGARRSITLYLDGCRKFSVPSTVRYHSRLVLNKHLPALERIRKIYLITTVYCVESLHLIVQIGGEECNYFIKGRIPIAFTHEKHRLHMDGSVQEKTNTDIAVARTAAWIQRDAFRDPHIATQSPAGIAQSLSKTVTAAIFAQDRRFTKTRDQGCGTNSLTMV